MAEEKEEEEMIGEKYIFAEERKKEESIWEIIIFFCGGDENGGGKGEKYQEKENISCGGEEILRLQRGKICGEGKYFFVEEKKNGEG